MLKNIILWYSLFVHSISQLLLDGATITNSPSGLQLQRSARVVPVTLLHESLPPRPQAEEAALLPTVLGSE